MELPNNSSDSETHQRRLTNVLLMILISVLVGAGLVNLIMLNRLSIAPKDVIDEIHVVEQQIKSIESSRRDADIFLQVLDNLGSAIVGLDSNGTIIAWSRGAEKMFGHNREDAVGYGIAFLIPQEQRATHRAVFVSRMQSNSLDPFFHQIECEAVHASGDNVAVKISIWGVPHGNAIAVFTGKK